ncbi:hypothetical protein Tco_1081044 [Tanacetum coccineum]|uniref:Uncharacterized protein n=1 Tax=Tanacetum coccineum TaxID=301880 RepID=A0ABQ5HWK6_9ASTR
MASYSVREIADDIVASSHGNLIDKEDLILIINLQLWLTYVRGRTYQMGLKLISLWLRMDLETTRKYLRLSSMKAVLEKRKKRFLICVKNRIYYENASASVMVVLFLGSSSPINFFHWLEFVLIYCSTVLHPSSLKLSLPIHGYEHDKDKKFTFERMGQQLSDLGLEPSKSLDKVRSKSRGRKRERSSNHGGDEMDVDNDGSNKKLRLRSLSRSTGLRFYIAIVIRFKLVPCRILV